MATHWGKIERIFPECVPGFSLVRYLPVAGKECWSRLKLLSAPCFVESGHCHRLSRGSRSSSCRGNSWLWHSNPNSHILSNCLPDPEGPYTVRCKRNLNDRIKGLLYILRVFWLTVKLPFDYRCHGDGARQKAFFVLGQHLAGQVPAVAPAPHGHSRLVDESEIVDNVSTKRNITYEKCM